MDIAVPTRPAGAPLRLLCILAYPDDEAVGGALACYAAEDVATDLEDDLFDVLPWQPAPGAPRGTS
jgi:hypothetical protein